MKFKNFGFLILPAFIIGLSSCLGDDEYSDYKEWRQQNLAYIENAENETEGGKPKYEKVTPSWDKSFYILMRWHNDRGLTVDNLSPLDNSTCNVKYLLRNIEGDTIESSYSLTENGDSIFQCQPNGLVTGFWTALTSMNVGDSVTAIMPYTAGYGAYGSGAILPYSTLIFEIKLVSIPSFETLPGRQ